MLTTLAAVRKMRPMAASAGPTLRALGKSGLVLAGLLLLGVGIGNSLAGHTKIAQYEEVLRTAPAPPPSDPTTLFPRKSKAEEDVEEARRKVGFYERLVSVGQLLSALGFALVAAGVLRLLRIRTARATP